MANFSACFAFRGTFIHAPHFGNVECLEDHVCVVSSKEQGGKILALVPATASLSVLAEHGILESTIYNIPDGRFMCPGFVDVHCHAPQYSYSGTATDKPLMAWLEDYTFPREARHHDLSLARREYSKLLQRLTSNGTTTALYFATLHLESTQLLAQLLHQVGQRAYVGLVCMDRNSKDFYTKSLEQNIADTESFIASTRALGSALVQPVVTPRFVPTCSPELLARLGALAQQHNCHVQSHISESLDNDAFVAQLHPEVGGRDARLYDRAGLLTKRSVMAHGVTLTSAELALLAERGTAIAHCPLSNFFFADIPLDVLRCRQLGVKVGLGTDVAGGYSPSMLSAMRSAVVAAKAVRLLRTDRARLAARPRPAAHAGRPEFAAQPRLALANDMAPLPGLAPVPDLAARQRPAAPDAPPAEDRPSPHAAATSAAGRARPATDQGINYSKSYVNGPVPGSCAAEHAAAEGQGTASGSPLGFNGNACDSGCGAECAEESWPNGNAGAGPQLGSIISDGCHSAATGNLCTTPPGCTAEMPDEGTLQDPGCISVDGLGTGEELDYRGALWLATMGGAQALGLEDTIGSFEVGKDFDALMVDPTGGACFDTFTGDTLVDVFQKFINLGDDRNIRAVWVRGGLVLWK
ncbi:g10645 [Coccomyxa elongata]